MQSIPSVSMVCVLRVGIGLVCDFTMASVTEAASCRCLSHGEERVCKAQMSRNLSLGAAKGAEAHGMNSPLLNSKVASVVPIVPVQADVCLPANPMS